MLTSCEVKMIIIGPFILFDHNISVLNFFATSVEAAFKSLALALRQAIERTGGNDIPSTKGVL